MRLLILIGLICTVVVSHNILLTNNFINSINSQQQQWRATNENQFSGMSTEQIKVYLGTILQDYGDTVRVVSYSTLLENIELPEQFNAGDQWPKCIHQIRNQGHCGSCWAFGASEVLSDRVCIGSSGEQNHVLSPQWMVSCDKLNLGCKGGILPVAWFYLFRHGIPSEECLPYTSSEGERGKCPSECVDGSKPEFYRVKAIRTFKRPEDVKLEILTNGPVETGFMVYEDFMGYSSGIYKYTQGNLLGGHAVKVVGWGISNNIKYWIAANSWGENWGENGFFKIQEGQCRFESQIIAGTARV